MKKLDMPEITMVFQVKDAAMLDKIQSGDKVNVTAIQQSNAFVVSAILALPSCPSERCGAGAARW